MTPKPENHYAVLGVAATATAAEIKRGYRRLMREVHPDANSADPQATRKAARINHAFETLGDPEKRRAYDATLAPPRRSRRPATPLGDWVVEEGWEDVVAAAVPQKRPAHTHRPPPTIEPVEIEVDMEELREHARVRRTVRVENPCTCTLVGDVSTSEPWVWGPVGRFRVAPDQSAEFEIEVIARKVTFPGISRVSFVAGDWTGSVPVKITGYAAKPRPVRPAATGAQYVQDARARRRKWAKYRR